MCSSDLVQFGLNNMDVCLHFIKLNHIFFFVCLVMDLAMFECGPSGDISAAGA